MEASSVVSVVEGGASRMTSVLFVSLTVNLCLTLRLFVSGFAHSVKLFRKSRKFSKKKDTNSGGLGENEKDIVNILVNESVNLLLAGLALACVCVHPVQRYALGAVPTLLHLLISANCGRYFYRIGILISLKRSTGGHDTSGCHDTSGDHDSVWYYCGKLLHYVPALLFHLYVIAFNELWWLAVIGNFAEMESLVTSIHGILRRVYSAYESISRWCLAIQVTSGICVRILLPMILFPLFNGSDKGQVPLHVSIVLYATLVYFGLYNIYLIHLKVVELCKIKEKSSLDNEVQVIEKQPVPYVEINDIFNNGGFGKSKLSLTSLTSSCDVDVISEKQMTWSMVPLEDISSRITAIQKCSKHKVIPRCGMSVDPIYVPQLAAIPEQSTPGDMVHPGATDCNLAAITASCPQYSSMETTHAQNDKPVLNNQVKTKSKSVRFVGDFDTRGNMLLKSTANINIDQSQRGKTDAFYDSKFLLFNTKS